MSLHEFRQSRKPELQRPLDVRTLSVAPEAEREIPYPIPAEIELPYSDIDWRTWSFNCKLAMIKGEKFKCMRLAFCLKVLDSARASKIFTSVDKEIAKEWATRGSNLNETLELWYRYYYFFSEVPEKVFSSADISLAWLLELFASENVHKLFDSLTHTRLLFPHLVSQEVLEQYWPKLFAEYRKGNSILRLKEAAYLRILYPWHLSELEITREQIELWGEDCDYEKCAYRKILAQPEIPGLTTWPPKSAETKITDSIPEMPETLKL